jgi:hypothetical protein
MSFAADLTDISSIRVMITNTLNKYAWAYCRQDFDLLGECFTADAEVEFSTGWQKGRAAVLEELARRRALYASGQIPWHVLSNIFVRDESPVSATVTCWFSFGVMEKESPATLNVFGWYDDKFVLEQSEWRVDRRRVLLPWEQ